MKKIYLIFLVLCASKGFSQEKQVESKASSSVTGGLAYFEMGVSQINIKNLNSALIVNGYPTFNQYSFSMGGGGHVIIKNIIIGGEGHGLNEKDRSNDAYQTSIEGGYGLFNLGYVICSKKRWLIYPMVGVGNGSYTLRMGQNSATMQFDSLLANPKREVALKISGLILSAQLSIEHIFGSDNGGTLIGLHAGYNFSPSDWAWGWNNSNIHNAPSINMDGFFLRVSIGAGGYAKKNN